MVQINSQSVSLSGSSYNSPSLSSTLLRLFVYMVNLFNVTDYVLGN